jgi:uncharacterized protein (DUF1697 family)
VLSTFLSLAFQPVSRARLREESTRRLPFDAKLVICQGREIVELISQDPFARQPTGPDIVHFVSVLSQRHRSQPPMPVSFPSSGKWLVRILARKGQFVFGMYRRHMKVISYLGMLDRLFGVRVTTRNWNTISAIANVVGAGGR